LPVQPRMAVAMLSLLVALGFLVFKR